MDKDEILVHLTERKMEHGRMSFTLRLSLNPTYKHHIAIGEVGALTNGELDFATPKIEEILKKYGFRDQADFLAYCAQITSDEQTPVGIYPFGKFLQVHRIELLNDAEIRHQNTIDEMQQLEDAYTVEFNSDPEYFEKEKDGRKPNTVRTRISYTDPRLSLLAEAKAKKIRIKNTLTGETFEREITDISIWSLNFDQPYGNQLFFIISWKHPAGDKRKWTNKTHSRKSR